jgi:indole-3-glycerol phosphate synthase
MTDILSQICADKLDYVRRCEHLIPQIVFEERARLQGSPRGFCAALHKNRQARIPSLIAEIKKASPSKGIICTDFDPPRIAKAYETAGATCLSVLTDRPYFKGQDEDLEAAREVTSLPVLRKDFMLTPYQIWESRAIGADCILLIMAALSDAQAGELYGVAKKLGMDVLVEVHDREELDRALTLSPEMIGVNCRSLKTLAVSPVLHFDLLSAIPEGIIRVAESGIASAADLKTRFESGYDAFLVGESLMKTGRPGDAAAILLGNAAESA